MSAATLEFPTKPLTAYIRFQKDILGDRWQQMPEEEKATYVAQHEQDMKTWTKGEKKPLTAYFRFQQSLKIAEQWKELAADERQKYVDSYKTEKQTYDEQRAAYDAMYYEKALTAPPAPKKPQGEFFLYVNHLRANVDDFEELQNKKQTDFVALAAKKWKSLPENKKQPFVDASKRLDAEYAQQCAEYERQYGNIAYVKDVQRKNAKANESRKRRGDDMSAELSSKKRRAASSEKEVQQFYRSYWLQRELEKVSVKLLKLTPAALSKPLIFDRDATLREIDEKWNGLSVATKKVWQRRYAAYVQSLKADEEESLEYCEQEDEAEEDENDDNDEEEDGGDEHADDCDADDFSDEEDIDEYGDDGDDFVVPDDIEAT